MPRGGVDDVGTYCPTPAEIREHCREIQSRWGTREERLRRVWTASPWLPPQTTCDEQECGDGEYE